MRSASATASATSCVTTIAVKPFACHTRLDQVLHLDPGERVERAERLIEGQQARMADQRAGECYALLLPARQHAGPVVAASGQADLRQHVGAAWRPLAAAARMRQADRHVAATRSHGSRRGSWNISRRASRRRSTSIAAAVRRVQPRDQPQQRRFAAAAAADDGDECAGLDVKVDAAQHVMRAERLCHTSQA